MPNHDRISAEHDAQAEAIATRAADSALDRMMRLLGFDLTDSDDVRRWHRQRQWIETTMLAEEKRTAERRKHRWAAVVAIGTGLVVSGFTSLGGLILDGAKHALIHFTTGGKP